VPTVTGVVAKGKRLTAHAGTWSGAPPLTFTFRWERCPAKVSASPVCVTIARATKTTYTPVAADVGQAPPRRRDGEEHRWLDEHAFRATAVVVRPRRRRRRGKRLLGTAQTDRLLGSAVADLIHGRRGNDRIDGRAGADLLYGDGGNDSIVGGAGPDSIFAGSGNDSVSRRTAPATSVDCGPGDDRVTADAVDVLRGCEHVTRKP
jgi:hypothetical protein